MRHQSWHRKVHGADLPHQMLYILTANVVLSRWSVQKGEESPKLLLQEGNRSCIRVKYPPQDLLDAGPVALSRQEFLTLAESLYRRSILLW